MTKTPSVTLLESLKRATWEEVLEAWRIIQHSKPKSCPIYRKIGAENLKIGETISIEISVKNEAKKVIESCLRFARKNDLAFAFKTVPGSDRKFLITRLR